jgi:hypothetical protein
VTDLWLPPGARRPFDADVERVIEEADDPAEARRLAEELRDRYGLSFGTDDGYAQAVAAGEDPAEILFPRAWGRVTTTSGRKVLAAYVKSDALERMILDSTAQVELSSVVDRAEHPMIAALCPALSFRLRHVTTITPLEYHEMPCPIDWRAAVQEDGFALAIYNEEDPDARVPYIASPPLRPSGGLILPGRGTKVGRNDPCPCGSGIKFKRCCGARGPVDQPKGGS